MGKVVIVILTAMLMCVACDKENSPKPTKTTPIVTTDSSVKKEAQSNDTVKKNGKKNHEESELVTPVLRTVVAPAGTPINGNNLQDDE